MPSQRLFMDLNVIYYLYIYKCMTSNGFLDERKPNHIIYKFPNPLQDKILFSLGVQKLHTELFLN